MHRPEQNLGLSKLYNYNKIPNSDLILDDVFIGGDMDFILNNDVEIQHDIKCKFFCGYSLVSL